MSVWTELLDAEVRRTGRAGDTRIVRVGQGPPLLLLHGQGGHLENFARNVRRLSQHFDVLAIDLLWHGRSATPPVDPQLIPSFVSQVIDVLDAERIDRLYVEGQSLGGWVAAALSAAQPDRIERLVLTTPMGIGPGGGFPPPEACETILDTQLRTLADPSWENIRARLLPLVHDAAELADETIAIRRALYADPATNAALRDVARAYFTLGGPAHDHEITAETLGACAQPTLVYWGRANVVPPKVGRAIAKMLPNSEFHCSAAGHLAQYDLAEEHDAVVTGFLTQSQP